MTTPTLTSDQCTPNLGRGKYRHDTRGMLADQCTLAIPAATTAGTNAALFYVKQGFRLLNMVIRSDDVDTTTNTTYSVGLLYETPSATVVENIAAYLTASTIGQTGTEYIYHVTSETAAQGQSIQAAGDGWLALQVVAGPTTTTGNVYVTITFDYGVPVAR